MDTPVFERTDLLKDRYGDENKLIYDLKDQGGEFLSLRYDLTIPFARYLIMNNISNMKRYQISKVYRRDNISIEKGRFREFYQCDFDIAGEYEVMMADAEILKILHEVLTELDMNFKIKINDRRLLDAIFKECDINPSQFKQVASAIDKLDKMEWTVVKMEMIEKGISKGSIDKLEPYISLNGSPHEMLTILSQKSILCHELKELSILFEHLTVMEIINDFTFDLSLARGLHYYTGVIFEAVPNENGQSSIAAGGRYDELVSSLSSKKIPCVGMSIGIDRICALFLREQQHKEEVTVLVASIGPDLTKERMSICCELWRHNISAKYLYDASPTTKKQLKEALKSNIPFVIFVGEEEIKHNNVIIKDMQSQRQISVKRNEMIDHLLNASFH